MKMLSIVLLGSGNVAGHIFKAISKTKGAKVIQVYGRDTSKLRDFEEHTQITTDYNAILEADIYIIAVKDAAIQKVSEYLGDKKGLVVHTSGSASIDVLKSERKGVFYPLQSFTKDRDINFKTIPICLESENLKDLEILETLAKQLSDSVHLIDSEERKTLHLAAVFVNNFTNHLFYIADEICNQNELDFKILKPLVEETINKTRFLSPKEAQTGPARRNDIETMQRHLEDLKNTTHKKIYQVLSESIKTTYEKEL